MKIIKVEIKFNDEKNSLDTIFQISKFISYLLDFLNFYFNYAIIRKN